MKLDETKRKCIVIALLVLLGISVGANALYSPLAPQWEVSATLSQVVVNGVAYSDDNRPSDTQVWGLSHVRFDVDEEFSGVPDLDISLTNPAHVVLDKQTGDYVPADDDQVFYQYSKIVGSKVVFYDQHVYTFWLTVIADPDVYHGVQGWGATVEAKPDGLLIAEAGLTAGVNVYVHFKADAWEIGPPQFVHNETIYNKADGWYGVMSASVLQSYAGLVDKGQLEKTGDDWDYTDATEPLSGYHAAATETGAVNMYSVNSTHTQQVPDLSDRVARNDTISGVPTEVELSLYGELLPGSSWPPLGSISTSAVMFQYKVRVDVLVSAGYVLASGQQPEDNVDPTVIDKASDPIARVYDFLTTDGATFIQFVIVILVLVAIIRIAPAIVTLLRRK